jgi:H+-transporting ATPase
MDLDGAVCPPGPLPEEVHPEQFAVYAGVLPEYKYKLIRAFQKGGHTVGMCGDGANDAPALRQAQIGIAVFTATDVAKSAAGMVLTGAGLAGVVGAVKEGRVTFQRNQTYTLNSIIKKIATVLFLIVGLVMTGKAILTPSLMVLVMVTGDFLAMGLATDKVQPSLMPNTWRISRLLMAGAVVGCCLLTFCVGVLAEGKYRMNLSIEALRTLAFILLVFGGHASIYAIRERRHLWGSRPSSLLVVSSIVDITIAATLAVGGFAMTPLPLALIAATLRAAILFSILLDLIKIPLFAHLDASPPDAASFNANPAVSTPLQEPTELPSHKTPVPPDFIPQVAIRAYELYEQRGNKDGTAAQDWEAAESQIRHELAAAGSVRETKLEPKRATVGKT